MFVNPPFRQTPAIRVAFLLPWFHLGGVEEWLFGLLRSFASCRGVGLVIHGQTDDAAVAEARRLLPVVVEQDVYKCGRRLQKFARQADVLVAWAVEPIRELTAGIDIPIVGISHCTEHFHGVAKSNAYVAAVAHRLAAVSHAAITGFPRQVREHVSVLYPGADPNRCAPRFGREQQRADWQLREEDKVILFLGRLAEEKRAHLIVEAMAHLPPKYRAIFVGPDNVKPGAYAGWREIESKARMIAAGRVSRGAIVRVLGDVLAAADVMCLPSVDESFCIARFEAHLAGLPVVTCDYAASREIEQRFGPMAYVCSSGPTVLASRIQAAVIQGREGQIAQNAREKAWQHFTTAAAASRFEAFLQETVAAWHSHALYPAMSVVA